MRACVRTCVCVCVRFHVIVCVPVFERLRMFIYASMHCSLCVRVHVCVCVCISKARGLTDAPSQWTQWITYRSLSQTRLRRPLVYPTLIGPSAEVALAFTRCSLQRRNQKLICKGGASLLIKNIRASENCLRAFVRVRWPRMNVHAYRYVLPWL